MTEPPKSKAYKTAGLVLAYIGGDTAVNILRREYSKSKSIYMKGLLCTALATTGTSTDVDFLIDALNGKPYGNKSFAMTNAAISLGILRAKTAIDHLTKLANKPNNTFATSAAKNSLEWIRVGDWDVPCLDKPLEKDELILAIFRNGIPNIDRNISFYESESNRVWSHNETKWSLKEDNAHNNVPEISFDTYITSDNKAALVSVYLYFNPEAAYAYDFILKKQHAVWKVNSIFFTAVS